MQVLLYERHQLLIAQRRGLLGSASAAAAAILRCRRRSIPLGCRWLPHQDCSRLWRPQSHLAFAALALAAVGQAVLLAHSVHSGPLPRRQAGREHQLREPGCEDAAK